MYYETLLYLIRFDQNKTLYKRAARWVRYSNMIFFRLMKKILEVLVQNDIV